MTRAEAPDLSHIAEGLRPLAVPIGDVRKDPFNVRKHPDRNLAAIRESLRRFGQRKPVVANRRTGVIEAGNGTWEAASSLGWLHLAVLWVEDDPTSAVGYSVADNRAAELAEWDEAGLAKVLRGLKEAGEDLGTVGFSDRELREVTDRLARAASPQGDGFDPEAALRAAPELAARVAAGQIWKLGRHSIMCGDSTRDEDVALLIGPGRPRIVLTDPPYNLDKPIAGDDLDAIAARHLHDRFVRLLPVSASILAVFQSTRTFPVLLDAARRSGWEFERILWLSKPNAVTFPWRGWILKSEAILLFSKPGAEWLDIHPYVHDTYTVIWSTQTLANLPSGTTHPTIKPLSCVRDILSRLGGDVFDPFLGSGTTLIAAEQEGRTCWGMEIDPKYVALSIARWEAETGLTAEQIGEVGRGDGGGQAPKGPGGAEAGGAERRDRPRQRGAARHGREPRGGR